MLCSLIRWIRQHNTICGRSEHGDMIISRLLDRFKSAGNASYRKRFWKITELLNSIFSVPPQAALCRVPCRFNGCAERDSGFNYHPELEWGILFGTLFGGYCSERAKPGIQLGTDLLRMTAVRTARRNRCWHKVPQSSGSLTRRICFGEIW